MTEQNMKEFDPECEKHWPLLIVKVVDPGCTLEVQIENVVTGKITRLSSTEDASLDQVAFENALVRSFRLALQSLDKQK